MDIQTLLEKNLKKPTVDADRIEFSNYADAMTVLNAMRSLASEYGYAAVADYYDIVHDKTGKGHRSYDFQHGWTINDLQASQINGSYSKSNNKVCVIINLPKAKIVANKENYNG